MENTYIAQASDLTAVADAIRAKGETAEPLAFPDGFVAAIQGISGGGLNFEVVGGMEQPGNPGENTIWINTGTEISGWIFSAEAPAPPINGMVWIKTGRESPTEFNAVKENGIIVPPSFAKQYSAGVWADKEGMIYQAGAWVDLWDRGLFKDGETYEHVTGGWSSDSYSISGFNHTDITLGTVGEELAAEAESGSKADKGGLLGTANLIDLNGFTAMRVRGNVAGYKSNCRALVGVTTQRNITATSAAAQIRLTANGDFDQMLELPTDIDKAYVFVLCGCYTATATEYTTTLTVHEISLA